MTTRCDECKHWGPLRGNEFRNDGAKGFLRVSTGVLGRCGCPAGHRYICRDGTKGHSHVGATTYDYGPLSTCLSILRGPKVETGELPGPYYDASKSPHDR